MAKYRNKLPQLSDKLFLTDGGLETTLIFHDKIELPYFASFDLLRSLEGTQRLRDYFKRYIAMANKSRSGFVLEAPTWRANPDWASKLGYSYEALEQVNRDSIDLLAELQFEYDTPQTPMVISGNIGPRGDGYKVENAMTAQQAQDYHGWQVGVFARTQADLVSAFTMNYVEEAIGVARACQAASMPCVISFTVETDGRLPSGQLLRDAIEQTDRATNNGPAYYMLNCAHPTHFSDALRKGESWTARIRGLRANASVRSHAELDAAPDLDIGDPVDLGRRYRALRREFPRFTILGGCCGTDHRHVEQICLACVEVQHAA